MKIYHKVEYWKGYIPSDKVHYKHIPFEACSIANFGISYKESKDYRKNWTSETKKLIVEQYKAKIMTSKFWQEIVKAGHCLYLNFNMDGIDCFISR